MLEPTQPDQEEAQEEDSAEEEVIVMVPELPFQERELEVLALKQHPQMEMGAAERIRA